MVSKAQGTPGSSYYPGSHWGPQISTSESLSLIPLSHGLRALSRYDLTGARIKTALESPAPPRPLTGIGAPASRCAPQLPGPKPSARPLSDRCPPGGAPPACGRPALVRASLTLSGPPLQLSFLSVGSERRRHGPSPALQPGAPLAAPFPRLPPGARRTSGRGRAGSCALQPGPPLSPDAHVGVLRSGRGKAGRPPGGGGRAGRTREEAAGRGGEGGEPRRQGGGDSA